MQNDNNNDNGDVQLSEHEKAMLNVADNGDPNAPDDTKSVNLPSEEKPAADEPQLPEGVESVEDLINKFNELNSSETDEESEGDEAKGDGEGEEGEEEADERDEKLAAAEEKLREISVYETVGGKEEYSKLIEWADQNLSEEQVEVYDAAVMNGSPEQAAFAASALKAMSELHAIKNHGYSGQTTIPSTSGGEVLVGYKSDAEMVKDMNDPRYDTDPAFRARVEQKLAVS